MEADDYETTHLSLSVPDNDGITVEMTPAPADEGGTDDRTVAENEVAVQAIAS